MTTTTLFLVAMLSSTAEPAVPVQRPASAPTDPAEAEPTEGAPSNAEAPATTTETPSESSTAKPPVLPDPPGAAAVEPEPEPAAQPEPVVEPPVEPQPPLEQPPPGSATAPEIPQPDFGEATNPLEGYVRVTRPEGRGVGMLGTAAGLWGFAVLYQLGDRLLCGGCASGVFEHAVLGTAIGLAAGGGARLGGAWAYDDAVLKKEPRDARKARNVGLALLAGGAALTIINDALFYSCWLNNEGPYASGDATFCRHGVSRLLLDLGTGAVGTGAALTTGSIRYSKHSSAYARARTFSVTPSFGRSMAGLRFGGRF